MKQLTPLVFFTCGFRLNNIEILAKNIRETLEYVSPCIKLNMQYEFSKITWIIVTDTRTAIGSFNKDNIKQILNNLVDVIFLERYSDEYWHMFDHEQINYGINYYLKNNGDINSFFYMLDDDNWLNPKMFISYTRYHENNHNEDVIKYTCLNEHGIENTTSKTFFNISLPITDERHSVTDFDPSSIMFKLTLWKKYNSIHNMIVEFIKQGIIKSFINTTMPVYNKFITYENTELLKMVVTGNYAYDFSWYALVIQSELNENNVWFSSFNCETYHNCGAFFDKVSKDREIKSSQVENINEIINNENKFTNSYLYIDDLISKPIYKGKFKADNDPKDEDKYKQLDDFFPNIIPLNNELLSKIWPIIFEYYNKNYKK